MHQTEGLSLCLRLCSPDIRKALYMKLKLPPKVVYILDILERNGFEAYVVGGCVRDAVLAKEPKDWDITTGARPDEV